MRRDTLDGMRRGIRDGRAGLAVLLGLSVAANLALALASGERTTVLVPASGGTPWEIGEGHVDPRYLEDMARTAAATLLTLTPDNAAEARRAAARMSDPAARGAIAAWVAAEAERLRRRDLVTAFWPERVRAGDGLTVTVEGALGTWMGREPLGREDRSYRLAFRLDGGRLGLLRFEQLEVKE